MDLVTSRIEQCITLLLTAQREKALAAVRSIDFAGLVRAREEARQRARTRSAILAAYRAPAPRAKRQNVKVADVRATFSRDSYICRYAHCQRPTIALPALKLLSAALPEVLSYHRNWRPVDQHILYWTYSTSLEHRISFPNGGTSAANNLLTACYQCNDIKNSTPVELLGWSVADPVDSSWRGLSEYIPELSRQVSATPPDLERVRAQNER